MVNSSITGYANVISQASNQDFRQAIQQIRNNCETSQFNFYKTAEQKGYYKPAQPASPQDIQQVKSQFGG
jgi:spore coat protein CotF